MIIVCRCEIYTLIVKNPITKSSLGRNEVACVWWLTYGLSEIYPILSYNIVFDSIYYFHTWKVNYTLCKYD